MNVTASSVAAAPLSVAFIGVGEAGQTFARGLHAEGVRDIRLYDILFDAPQSSLRATASAMANELPGVRLCASHAEAVRGASLVFLAVTAAWTQRVPAFRRWARVRCCWTSTRCRHSASAKPRRWSKPVQAVRAMSMWR